MHVEIVIPYAGACPHRAQALAWVLDRYAAAHPDWPVTIAPAADGPWVKSRTIMPAIAQSSADVIVVADADVWADGIDAAVHAIADGAPWAIPHLQVRRLTADATAAVLAGAPWSDQPAGERVYVGIQGGGIVAVPRATALDVPPDPRYVGWGQEDESWGLALTTLAGPAWRGDEPLTHLWHPPQPRMTRRRGSRESWDLFCRYRAAEGDPDAMRALIAEHHEQPRRTTHGHVHV